MPEKEKLPTTYKDLKKLGFPGSFQDIVSPTPRPTPYKPRDLFRSPGPDNAFGQQVEGKTVHSQQEEDAFRAQGFTLPPVLPFKAPSATPSPTITPQPEQRPSFGPIDAIIQYLLRQKPSQPTPQNAFNPSQLVKP